MSQRPSQVRGIRGAISVAANEPNEIIQGARRLLEEMLAANSIEDFDDIVSIFFTTTPDLNATFPAEAARGLGMNLVPLLCASEIAVPGRLPRCIRVLMHVSMDRSQAEVRHVYLGEAAKLRPDMNSAQ